MTKKQTFKINQKEENKYMFGKSDEYMIWVYDNFVGSLIDHMQLSLFGCRESFGKISQNQHQLLGP